MRRVVLGVAIWAIGTMALAIWGSIIWAPRIEAKVRGAAEGALAEVAPDADLTLRVSGRDLDIGGLASNTGGAAAVRAALRDVSGMRVLRSDLQDLPVAVPYVLTVQKDGARAAQGVVPSAEFQAELSDPLGAAVKGLTLAAGMPEGWDRNAKAGLAALALMQRGKLSVEGLTVVLTGEVMTAQDMAAVDAALADVALLVKDVAVLDDGQPIAYRLVLDGSNSGAKTGPKTGRLDGKLPFGVTPDAIAAELGLPRLDGDARTALIRETGDIRYLAAWAPVLDRIDGLTAEVGPNGRLVTARVKSADDADSVAKALETGDFVVTIEAPEPPPPPPAPDKADEKSRATATPMLDKIAPARSPLGFEITVAGCQGASDALLAKTTILFLPNLDTLDDSAVQVLEQLAAIARDCAAGALVAEIGGHSDTSGDAAENLALSARRAEAVRSALIAAGVPEATLTAKGYGAAQPIADNETKEGRIKNRRTTVLWQAAAQ